MIAGDRSINDSNNAKQDYSFITSLENIYHLTIKDSQTRLAKGRIRIDYKGGQEFTGEEGTDVDVELENIEKRKFKLKGYIDNNHLFYFGISDWNIGKGDFNYSATFFNISRQYGRRERICGIMVCDNSHDFSKYITQILLTKEQLSDNEVLSSMEVCHDFSLLMRRA